MSTIYTVGSGKTYSTITAAIAAIPSNLSGTGIHEVVIDAGSYSFTVPMTVSKSNGSATNYIIIRAASGAEHKGLFNSGVVLYGSVTAGYSLISLSSNYCRIQDIAIRDDGSFCTCLRLVNPFTIAQRILVKMGPSDTGIVNELGTLIDCYAFPFGGAALTLGIASSYPVYNCGVYGARFGIQSYGSAVVQNSFALNSAVSDFIGTPGSASSNNLSSDSTAFGSSSLINQSASSCNFVDTSIFDFHVQSGSVLLGSGSNQSSIFTTDIDGETILSWPIGPDFLDPVTTFKISGAYYKVRPWPQFIIKPAISFVQNSKGLWSGSDRGAAQDIYESYLTFQGTDTTINNLQTALNAAREAITLSGFNTDIFFPNVDQSGSVTATITNFGERKQLQYNGAAASVLETTIGFRAISPTILSTTPSLSTLRLQEGWAGDHSTEIAKGFSLTQVASYADRNSDSGKFVGTFSQSTTELKAILAYLLVTVRAASFMFPTLSGVTYPFGISKGAGPFNVIAYSFSIQRSNLNRWQLTIDFREAP